MLSDPGSSVERAAHSCLTPADHRRVWPHVDRAVAQFPGCHRKSLGAPWPGIGLDVSSDGCADSWVWNRAVRPPESYRCPGSKRGSRPSRSSSVLLRSPTCVPVSPPPPPCPISGLWTLCRSRWWLSFLLSVLGDARTLAPLLWSAVGGHQCLPWLGLAQDADGSRVCPRTRGQGSTVAVCSVPKSTSGHSGDISHVGRASGRLPAETAHGHRTGRSRGPATRRTLARLPAADFPFCSHL